MVEHRVVEDIRGLEIHGDAREALSKEAGILDGHGAAGMRTAVAEIIGDGKSGAAPVMESAMNSAAGERGDHSGGVADEQSMAMREWMDDAAAGDNAGAALADVVHVEAELRQDLRHELIEVGNAAVAHGETDLPDADARDCPAEIAGRQAAIEIAVQKIGCRR